MKTFLATFLLLSSLKLLAQQSQRDCSSDAGLENKEELVKFTERLKAADSAENLAQMIVYPLRVNKSSKKHFLIKNDGELKSRFTETFPAEVLKVIQGQDPKGTFCNNQGLTIGDGTVWINKKNGKTGIYVVNLPAKK